MAGEVGAYYITIMPEMSQFTGAVKKALKTSGASGGKTFSTSFGEVLKGSAIGTALGNLATKAGSSIMSGLKTGIGRLDIIKNFPKVMEGLGYSTKDADKSIQTIMDHLDGLPTSTQDMVTLTQAISDSTGDLDLATKAALGFNDMMLANGASAAEMSTAQGVLNRVLGKGSATVAQWQSLTSVMPAQLGQVARHMLGAGASTEDLHAALEDGTVSWNDFLKAIVELDEVGEGAMDSFYEQAKNNSVGIGTALENIPNRIGAGWAAILEAIGQEEISTVINNMSYGVRDAMKVIAGAIEDLKSRLQENGAFQNIATIIGDLKARFGDFAGVISGAVSGAVPVIADLIGNALQWVVDHGDQINNLLDGLGGAFDTVAGALGDAFSTASGVLKDLIKDALEWVLDHGDAISGAFKGIADKISALADAISGVLKAAAPVLEDMVSGALQWVLDHGDGVATALAAIAGAIGVFTAYSAAVAVITGVSTAIEVLGMVTLGGGIAATLGELGAAFTLIAEAGGPLAGLMGAFGGALTFLAANPVVLVIAAIGALVAGLIWFFTQTETGQQLWSDFCNFLGEVWAGIKAGFDEMIGNIKENWETWSSEFQEAWSGFQEFFGGIAEGIKADFEEMVGNIKENWEKWTQQLEDAKAAAGEFVKNVGEKWASFKADAKAKFDSACNNIKTNFSNLKADAEAKWAEISKNIGDKATEIKTNASNRISELKTSAGNFFGGLKNDAATKFEEMRTNLTTSAGNIKSAVSSRVSELKSGAVTKFGELRDGVAERFGAARDKISQILDKIKSIFGIDLGSAKSTALGIFDDIKNGIADKIQWAKDRVSDIVDGIKNLFDFDWSLPSPDLPHIEWGWQDVGGLVSIPYFWIDWYANGGIFDAATIIGIGEAGREAALPLNAKTYGEIARGITDELGNTSAGGVVVTGNTFVVREEADIERIADALNRKIRREGMAAA